MSEPMSLSETVLSVMLDIKIGDTFEYHSNPTLVRRDSEKEFTFIYRRPKRSTIARMAVDVLLAEDFIVNETFDLSSMPSAAPSLEPTPSPPSSKQQRLL